METYNWYQLLIKPSWAPPSYLFWPVWSVLYLIITISFWKVFIMYYKKQIHFKVILPFILNIFFNLIFTSIQFWLKNNLFASIDILLILSTIIWCTMAIYPYVKWVAYAQIPYLIWVSFATVLQLTITYLNW